MGDYIINGNQSKRTYAVTFEAEIYAENDPYEDCTNYPTPSFLSYEECDKEVFLKSFSHPLKSSHLGIHLPYIRRVEFPPSHVACLELPQLF